MKLLRTLPPVLASASLAFALACNNGSTGSTGPPGTPADTPKDVAPGDDAPAIVVTFLAVTGATGPGGNFAVGDRIALRFSIEKEDGTSWNLSEMDSAEALFSGPTFNYQRVIPLLADVALTAIKNADGSYTYVLPPIPAVYAPPLNDSPTFDEDEGELTGQALKDATYTAALSFAWTYEVEGEPFLQVGEAKVDLLVGAGAGALTPREVSQLANCNRCHVRLEAHEGRYREFTVCLLCHTSGAEDANDPLIAGGTPGVTIESRLLFHRIHNAKHLPSVIGITVDAAGARDYTATPVPLVYAADDGSVRDFSDVGFPVWPNRTVPMPETPLFGLLTDAEKAKENLFRTGITACFVCHFDPDGDGPIEAPAQGGVIYAQPSRKVCGACHDDIVWEQNYVGSIGPMPPQFDDGGCNMCHIVTGTNPLGTEEAHLHPLRDPTFNPGLNVEFVAVTEAGAADFDGDFDPGEKVRVSLRLLDDLGAVVDPANLDELAAVLSGPTTNLNLVHAVDVPTELLLAGPSLKTFNLPEQVALERAGVATAALGDVFTTARAPHLALTAAPTVVAARVAFGAGVSLTAADAPAGRNFLDLATTVNFVRGDFLVVADGTALEEYLQVQFVDGNRIWFSSPATPQFKAALGFGHLAGTVVFEVLLAGKLEGIDYTLDAAAGTITELLEFGAGNVVLVTYTTDFVVPGVFGPPLNGSPDVGETAGEWSGKPLVAGTYLLGLRASGSKVFFEFGVPTTYTIASEPDVAELLFSDALLVEPYALIDDPESCNACHQDLQFHDGRDRGFENCLLCHGASGSEDRPPYVAANAPPTPGAGIDLRSMLHKIPHARLLDDPASFTLVGAGPDPYPDNFEENEFATILFPAQPGATKNCTRCHGGTNTAWLVPAPRDHPTDQLVPVLVWRSVCAACHDSVAAIAHMELETTPGGVESCAICHAPGELLSVENVHRPR